MDPSEMTENITFTESYITEKKIAGTHKPQRKTK